MVDTTATTTNINEEEMSIMFFVFKAIVPGWSLSLKTKVTSHPYDNKISGIHILNPCFVFKDLNGFV